MAARITEETKARVRAAFEGLPATMDFTEGVEVAFKQAGATVSREKQEGRYYPSFFPWLGGARKKAEGEPRKTRKTRNGWNATETTLDEAVELLCDVIAVRVRASLGTAITSSALRTLPADSATSVVKTPAGLRSLTDGELRIACATARVNQDVALFERCKNELRRRENAAERISADSAGEE